MIPTRRCSSTNVHRRLREPGGLREENKKILTGTLHVSVLNDVREDIIAGLAVYNTNGVIRQMQAWMIMNF